MKGLTSVGEWLSLVEHLVRDQGVGGSNPLSPTNSFKQLERFQHPHFGCNGCNWQFRCHSGRVETESSLLRRESAELNIFLPPFE